MAADGDLRVLIALDLVLSALFSVVVVWVLSVADISEFAWTNVVAATLFLAVVTYLVVLRE